MASKFPLSVVLQGVDRLSGPLSKVEARLGKIGKKTSAFGKKLTLGVSLPILGMGAGIISTAAKFEESMNTVQALSSASTDGFADMRAQALELGKTTQFSASATADAMGELAVAGFEVNEILGLTPTTLDLASASGMEMAETAEILAGTMRASGRGQERAAETADLLTNAFTGSTVKLADLAEGLKVSVPVLTGMGISLEENAALMGALGNKMFQGTLAGTALKRATTSLANATPVTKATLASLEIYADDILDSEGNVKSLIGVVELLEDRGATTAQVLKIFGERAGPAMAALVQTGGASIRELETSMSETGTTAAISKVRMEGAAGGVRALKSASEGLAIAVADSGLLEAFTELVSLTTAYVQELSEANPALMRKAVIVAGVVAAVGPLIFVLGQTVTVLAAVATGVRVLGAALMFASANPIVLTIAGIVALGVAIVAVIKNADVIGEKFRSGFAVVKRVVSDAVGWVKRELLALGDLFVPDWLLSLVGGGGAVGVSGGGAIAAAGGAAIASGAPVGATSRSESLERRESRVIVELPNLPSGSVVRTEGADEDLDLDLGMVGAAL